MLTELLDGGLSLLALGSLRRALLLGQVVMACRRAGLLITRLRCLALVHGSRLCSGVIGAGGHVVVWLLSLLCGGCGVSDRRSGGGRRHAGRGSKEKYACECAHEGRVDSVCVVDCAVGSLSARRGGGSLTAAAWAALRQYQTETPV